MLFIYLLSLKQKASRNSFQKTRDQKNGLNKSFLNHVIFASFALVHNFNHNLYFHIIFNIKCLYDKNYTTIISN